MMSSPLFDFRRERLSTWTVSGPGSRRKSERMKTPAIAADDAGGVYLAWIDADGTGRYPAEVEATVYFCALEALQNVAKYAEATQATVAIRPEDGTLWFSVTDDGIGFDQGATGYGTGLQGIADRLAALDGDLEVESASGSGTSVTGRLPIIREARMVTR